MLSKQHKVYWWSTCCARETLRLTGGLYRCWAHTRGGVKDRNVGRKIGGFRVSKELVLRVGKVKIYREIDCGDQCTISLELDA